MWITGQNRYPERVLSRLAHMVRNPWLRVGLLAAVLAFAGYGLYVEWPAVAAALGRLNYYNVILSLAAAMGGATCMMLAWRAILADLGSPLPIRQAAKINFLSQLGKYVPGAVWAFAAQVELSHDVGVPRRRSVAAVAVSLALVAAAGLAVAAASLPFASPGMIPHYWWLLTALPLIFIFLCPPVFGRLIDRALILAKRPPLERRLTWRGFTRALAWTVLGFLLLGIQVWSLTSGITGRGNSLLLPIGAYALAYSAGLLLVIFPGGIGPRDFFLIAALTPVIPHGPAVAVALMTRVVATTSDIGCAGLALAVGVRKQRRPGAHRRSALIAASSDATDGTGRPADQIGSPGRPVSRPESARP